MKKFLLLILVIFISGCSNKKLNIDNIQSINYNDINLLDKDFEQIKKAINSLEFSKGTIDENNVKNLNIISKEKIHNFKISDNTIYYEEDNKNYISKNINNLNNILKEIENRYTDFSFFKISYGECNSTNDDLSIKINPANNCLIIDTNKILFNFKIHNLDIVDNNFNEVDLLYQKNEIDKQKIIIKFLILSTPKTKISFDTEYNYNISILPTYDEKTGKVEFNSSYVQKK